MLSCVSLVRLSKMLREEWHLLLLISVTELLSFGTDEVVDTVIKKQWVQWNCSAAVGVVCVM